MLFGYKINYVLESHHWSPPFVDRTENTCKVSCRDLASADSSPCLGLRRKRSPLELRGCWKCDSRNCETLQASDHRCYTKERKKTFWKSQLILLQFIHFIISRALNLFSSMYQKVHIQYCCKTTIILLANYRLRIAASFNTWCSPFW